MEVWRSSSKDGMGFLIILAMVSIMWVIVIYLLWVAYGEQSARMKAETARKQKLLKWFFKIWKNKTKCKTSQNNTNSNASYSQEIEEMKGEEYELQDNADIN